MYRLEYLQKAVDSVFSTAGHLDLEVIIVADEDRETYNLAETLKSKYGRIITAFNEVRQGKIGSPNIGLGLSGGHMLFHMMDDSVLYPGALDHALKSHTEILRGYGMVGFNDLNQHVVCTTTLFDRDFCQNILGGVMLSPLYRSFFADNENQEKAKRAGLFYYDNDAICEHLHSSNQKRPLTRYELSETQYWPTDEQTWLTRKENGFPITWDPIKLRKEKIIGTEVTDDDLRLGHTWYEVEYLKSFIREHRPDHLIEIGTHEGALSRELIKTFAPNIHFITIEIDCGIVRPEVIPYFNFHNRAELWCCDCFDINTIGDISRLIGSKIIYCDGGHKAKELIAYAPTCRRGDYLLSHDFSDGNRKGKGLPDNIMAEVLPNDIKFLEDDFNFLKIPENHETRIIGFERL